MKIIVGLGNPGLKHEKTRHNLGFMAIDAFFKDHTNPKDDFSEEKKFKSHVAELDWGLKKGNLSVGRERVILVKPQTYMNGSGIAVSAIAKFYKVKFSDIWVIHDEVDLPLGAMKIRLGGSSAGHKGVESIIEHLGDDKFWRFRLGIGAQRAHPEGKQLRHIDDFVLGVFIESEKGKSREIIKRAKKSVENALEDGMEKAMNKFNTK